MNRLTCVSPVLAAFGLFACVDAAVCPDGTRAEGGACRTACSGDVDCLLSESCVDRLCRPFEPDGRARVRLFRATPETVQPGASVVLEWVTVNADSVAITPSPGTGLPTSGSVEWTAPAETTELRLDASGAVEDAAATLTVRVVVEGPPAPEITEWKQVGREATCGDAHVAWSIQTSAAGGLAVSIIDAGDQVLHTDVRPTAEVVVSLDVASPLRLRVQQGQHTVTAETEVEPTLLCDADISPSTLTEDDTALLVWRVWAGATSVVVDPTGVPLRVWPGPNGLRYALARPSPPAKAYKVLAPRTDAPPDELTLSVAVTPRPHPPRIARFVLGPELGPSGAASFDVRIEWAVEGARAAWLQTPEGDLPLTGASGTLSRTVIESTELRLVAENEDGEASVARTAFRIVDEGADNRDPARARTLLAPVCPTCPVSLNAVEATIEAGIPDYFWFTAPRPGLPVRVRIRPSGTQTCERLPSLTVALTHELATPTVTPDLDPRDCQTWVTSPLPDGRIVLSVAVGANLPSPAPYVLIVDSTPSSCGDGVLSRPEESCDDANQTPQDGCSDRCTLEPQHAYSVAEGGTVPLAEVPVEVALVPYPDDVGAEDGEGFFLVPFTKPFTFYGRRYMGAFVHRRGVLTFDPADEYPPDLTSVTAGPRPAIYLLGAIQEGGSILVDAKVSDAARLKIAYLNAEIEGERSSAGATLYDDGRIGLAYQDASRTGLDFLVGVNGPFQGYSAFPDACEGGVCTGGLAGTFEAVPAVSSD